MPELVFKGTGYKQRLLAAITAAYVAERPARSGNLELVDESGVRIVCDLIFDENWKNDLNKRYFAS